MLIYADGSALARALVGVPGKPGESGEPGDAEAAAWAAFAEEAGDRLVTSPLGLTELRRLADPLGAPARESARRIADRVTVLRFSDQAVSTAARASVAAPPFTSIHVGIAVSHPDVEVLATYDLLLARLAVIYGLTVVSPGRARGWWDG